MVNVEFALRNSRNLVFEVSRGDLGLRTRLGSFDFLKMMQTNDITYDIMIMMQTNDVEREDPINDDICDLLI